MIRILRSGFTNTGITVVILLNLITCNASYAEDIPYFDCFKKASKKYSIHPALLVAIARVESNFDHRAINNKNRNGTSDYGLMQINSSWLDKLKEHGITKNQLINEPCINVDVGGWILAHNFYGAGVTWESVGAYNAGYAKKRESVRMKYANSIYTHYTYYRDLITSNYGYFKD